MALFSQRAGIRPLEKAFQRESIDVDLKNGLWTALFDSFVQAWNIDWAPGYANSFPYRTELECWVTEVWTVFLKQPGDTRGVFHDVVEELRKLFFREPWHWILDFLEFSAKVGRRQ